MINFNFANSYKQLLLSPEAINDLEDFLGRNFNSPNNQVVNKCAQLYRELLYEMNQIVGGYYSSLTYITKYKWKVSLDSGCYFVLSIVCDSNYRNVLFVIENFFFPVPLNGIYSILSERKIRIKESQLRRIIKESIKRTLNII